MITATHIIDKVNGTEWGINNQSAGYVALEPQRIDMFGRIRVSQPVTIFDSKQIHDNNPLFWESVKSAGGTANTYVKADAETVMSVSAAGEYAIRQTYQRFNYQPGKSQFILMTGVMGSSFTCKRRIGYFHSGFVAPYNPENGYYFENDETKTFSVNIVKAGVVERVTQSNFNYDKLDGTGISKQTIDLTKAQIFYIAFEWLGVGTAQFGVVIDGEYRPVHNMHHANTTTKVYTQTPVLPVRYEIRSVSGSGSMSQICASVTSEGGFDAVGKHFSIDNGRTLVSCNSDAIFNIITFRIRAGYEGKRLDVVNINILSVGNAGVRFGLIFNGTLSGNGAYNAVTNTGAEFSLAGTVSGGFQIVSGYTEGNDNAGLIIDSALHPGVTVAGVYDTVTLFAQRISSSASILGSVTIFELT